jgi:hypothetical protein
MTKISMNESMLASITADDVFAEILMLRNVSSKTFFVLESDSSCNTLDPHIATDSCETITAHSRQAVIDVIDMADQHAVMGVIGLVGRNWIGFGGSKPRSGRLFTCDLYDLEASLFFNSHLLDKIFAAHVGRRGKSQFLRERGAESVLGFVSRVALPVGVLRLVSQRNDFGLSMRRFPAHLVLNDEMTDIDLTRLIALARERSRVLADATADEMLQTLKVALSVLPTGDRDYCSGGDMICCLVCILAKKFHKTMSVEVFRASVRATLTSTDLKATHLYQSIDEWAKENNAEVWLAA